MQPFWRPVRTCYSNNNLARSWQAGISVAYNLAPHWRVRSGFNQRQTTQISSHHATLRLMDGLCLNPNDYGPKEYEFEYALLTGSGGANMTVRIAQEDSLVTMPDDEPFTLTMHTTRRSTDWVLPFSLQYTFGRGRWQGSVQAGGLLTLPGKTAVRVDHFAEQCADLCFSNGRTPSLTIRERGNSFYILKKNNAIPPANERGRKDVVMIPPMGGTARLIIRFDDFADPYTPYMYHCHILSHEDTGMMGQFIVNPAAASSVKENRIQNRVRIYPTLIRADEELRLDVEQGWEALRVDVFDQLGRMIFFVENPGNSIPTNQLAGGVNIISVSTAFGTAIFKTIKN